MLASQLRDSLLRTLWMEHPDKAPNFLHQDVAVAVNQAFQSLWAAPNLDYLRRRKENFTTTSGEAAYELDRTLLSMIGPVTTSSWPLIPLSSKGDWRHFAPRYLAADPAAASGQPRAYYLERVLSGNDEADSVTVRLLLAPAPSSAILVEYEAAFEPPVYSDCDLQEDKPLPIPHGFVETLLLPIARWHLTSSHAFKRSAAVDSMPAIEAQYQLAQAQLGYVGAAS